MNTTSHFSKFPPEWSLKGAGAKIPWNSEQALISSLIEVVYSQRRESYYTFGEHHYQNSFVRGEFCVLSSETGAERWLEVIALQSNSDGEGGEQ